MQAKITQQEKERMQQMTLIIFKIRRAYIRFYNNFGEDDFEEMIIEWGLSLKEIDIKIIAELIENWIKLEKWPPTIADIRNNYINLKHEEFDINEGEAWNEALKFCQNGYHPYDIDKTLEGLSKLNELTRQALKCVGIDSIRMADETGLSVARSNFLNIYKNLKAREFRDKAIGKENILSLRETIKQIEGMTTNTIEAKKIKFLNPVKFEEESEKLEEKIIDSFENKLKNVKSIKNILRGVEDE
jgi:hypothetical protein